MIHKFLRQRMAQQAQDDCRRKESEIADINKYTSISSKNLFPVSHNSTQASAAITTAQQEEKSENHVDECTSAVVNCLKSLVISSPQETSQNGSFCESLSQINETTGRIEFKYLTHTYCCFK